MIVSFPSIAAPIDVENRDQMRDQGTGPDVRSVGWQRHASIEVACAAIAKQEVESWRSVGFDDVEVLGGRAAVPPFGNPYSLFYACYAPPMKDKPDTH